MSDRDLMRYAASLAFVGLGIASSAPQYIGGGCEHQPNTRLANLPHVDTPKPLSKRRMRRLRGKAKGQRP